MQIVVTNARFDHIESLISQYKIPVEFKGESEFEFDIQSRTVYMDAKFYLTVDGYLSALHEIGHFVCGHYTIPKDWNEEANMELAAWAWALLQCGEKLEWKQVQKFLNMSILPTPKSS